MCKYCEIYVKSNTWEENKKFFWERLTVNKVPLMDIEFYISQGNKLIMYISQGNTCDSIMIKEKKIKYCPMCGKKLEYYEEKED